jgi:hypothetical protein
LSLIGNKQKTVLPGKIFKGFSQRISLIPLNSGVLQHQFKT